MSASAILSVMSDIAPNGAIGPAVGDSNTAADTPMADTFAGLLGQSELEMNSEETAENTEISDGIITPMATTPTPVPQPVAFNLVIDLASSKSANQNQTVEQGTGETQAFAPNVSASEIMPAPAEPQAAEAADAMAVPVASTSDTPGADEAVATSPIAVSAGTTSAPLPASTAQDASVPAQSMQAAKPSFPMPEAPVPMANTPETTTPKTGNEASSPVAVMDDLPVEAANIQMPDAERVTEPVAQRTTTPPQAVVQQAASLMPQVERKYAADARVTSDDTSDITNVDAASADVTAATTEASRAEPAAKASATESKPAPAFEAILATAATSPEGEAVDAAIPQLEQSQSAQSQTADAKGSQLSHATVRTTAELAAAMIHRLGNRSTRFDMILTPETLGSVEVSIEVGADGQMSARMAFDNPQATAEMRARAEELRRQLTEAGFDVAENALEFTDRENDPRGGFNQFMSDSRSGRRAFLGATRLADVADTPAVPVWTPLNLVRTGVDMKV